MSVYNGEKYLSECIDSILNQSFKDFEFLITDDGSTDNTHIILSKYSLKDNRIKIINNEMNLGLTLSLNNMVDIAKGEYIARMDADDVSLPDRFKSQLEFMHMNSKIGVCAVNAIYISNDPIKSPLRRHFSHEQIRSLMLFNNAMPHGPAMLKGDIFYDRGYRYNLDFKIMQDYELWQRLINITKFHVLKEVGYKVRSHNSSVTALSSKNNQYREGFLFKIYKFALNNFSIDASDDELSIHHFISSYKLNYDFERLHNIHDWLTKLQLNNLSTKYFEQNTFNDIISSYWYNICTRSSTLGIRVFNNYMNSQLSSIKKTKIKNISKLFIKCLFKYNPKFIQPNI